MRKLGLTLVAVGCVLLVGGLLGGAMSGNSDESAGRSPQDITSVSPEATMTPTAAVTKFTAGLARAIRTHDVEFLFNNLDPVVIDRYGADACRAYVTGFVDPTRRYEAGDIGSPRSWIYESDGSSDTIPDVVLVAVTGTADGQPIATEQHFALLDDGTVAWFTDCGTPER